MENLGPLGIPPVQAESSASFNADYELINHPTGLFSTTTNMSLGGPLGSTAVFAGSAWQRVEASPTTIPLPGFDSPVFLGHARISNGFLRFWWVAAVFEDKTLTSPVAVLTGIPRGGSGPPEDPRFRQFLFIQTSAYTVVQTVTGEPLFEMHKPWRDSDIARGVLLQIKALTQIDSMVKTHALLLSCADVAFWEPDPRFKIFTTI